MRSCLLLMISLLLVVVGCGGGSASTDAASPAAETTTPAPDLSAPTDSLITADVQEGDALTVADNIVPHPDAVGTDSTPLDATVGADIAPLTSCGSKSCDPGENCANCPGDCGANTLADFGSDLCGSFAASASCAMADVGRGPTAVPGATQSWFGYFRFESRAPQTFNGLEYWVLLPNATWQSTGGEPCQVVWSTTGKKGVPESCLNCDYALILAATLNVALTTCPQDLVKTLDSSYKVTYNVRVTTSSSELSFTSGKALGTGKVDGAFVTYQSAPKCAWF